MRWDGGRGCGQVGTASAAACVCLSSYGPEPWRLQRHHRLSWLPTLTNSSLAVLIQPCKGTCPTVNGCLAAVSKATACLECRTPTQATSHLPTAPAHPPTHPSPYNTACCRHPKP